MWQENERKKENLSVEKLRLRTKECGGDSVSSHECGTASGLARNLVCIDPGGKFGNGLHILFCVIIFYLTKVAEKTGTFEKCEQMPSSYFDIAF